MKTEYHQPVLLKESIDLLNVCEEGIYVDVTFGGGGHSREILRRLGEKGRLIAFDRDADSLQNQIKDERFGLIRTDFRFIDKVLEGLGIEMVDGILGDLGVSSHQFDVAERGFSFRFDAELDMRMDQDAEFNARDILNSYSENELRRILRDYGEIRSAGKLANAIAQARKGKGIQTTADLKMIVEGAVEAKNLSKILTLIFQALRIEVNGELDSLAALLQDGAGRLKPGGRIAIISYHSLEDRMVKNFFRNGNLEGEDRKDFFGVSQNPLKLVTKKAVQPTEKEVNENPRSRSARLRVAEKK